MQKNITKEKFWEIYETLPEELQDAIFSAKTAEAISNACNGSGLEDKTRQIASLVGDVLLGLSAISDFKISLELDLDMAPSQAQNIYSIINSSVFEPVKAQLQVISAPDWKPKKQEAPAENIAKTTDTETNVDEKPIIAEEKIEISKDNLPDLEPTPEEPTPVPSPAPKQRIRKIPAARTPEEPPAPSEGNDSYRESVG